MKTCHKREKGNMGEEIACRFIRARGFSITDRNYWKKYGEIDIVAHKDDSIHFFEVKSIVRNSSRSMTTSHRPEENVHDLKVRRLRKVIQTYMVERGSGLGSDFHFHVLCVSMNQSTRRARVSWLKDIVL